MAQDESTLDESLYETAEAALRERRNEWMRRLAAIRRDRRRENAPLEQDFAEQAVQRENDETLDALDVRGREELQAVEAALARLAAGTYGRCVRCDEPIAEGRIRAEPTATSCTECLGG